MIDKTFIIKNKLGLHARPAAMFVQLTTRFSSSVKVIKGDQQVDGKSIMGLMMLAAEKGSKLKIIIDGNDENQLLREIEDLFDSNFDDD